MLEGDRSYERIETADLERLAELAVVDQRALFERHPDISTAYRNRLLFVALCQGAALHFLDGKTGVKDFDVWAFYRESDARPFPQRRPRVVRDFGDAKFGKSPDAPKFVGRRVDILTKSIRAADDAPPEEVIRQYLRQPPTKTAALLSQKAVIAIHPRSRLGQVLWPETR